MKDEPIYKCFCKGTNREASSPRRSHNWATAKRAWFRIYEDRVECGEWVIPFNNVERAIVYRTSSLFMPVSILHLTTSGESYQFGFNPWASPIKHLNIEVEEQKVRLKHSLPSLIIRIVFLAIIAKWVWDYFATS